MFDQAFRSPLRFFVAAAVLAAILCLFPAKGKEPQTQQLTAQEESQPEQPVGADLSERTAAGCYLHRTLYYAPCGHSVQNREKLPAQLVGMSRDLLEKMLLDALPGAAVTGFSAQEIDAAVSTDIPCPLHWVLKTGEDGLLHVYQNRDGESLSLVRSTDTPPGNLRESDRQELLDGRIFDDVQALEGVLESMSS